MLRIQQVKHLCANLGFTSARVDYVIDNTQHYVDALTLCDTRKPGKQRDIICSKGLLREMQIALLDRVLLPKLKPVPWSNGGIKTRSVKDNATPHSKSRFLFKADIANFYPSIHRKRVYDLFLQLECSPDVARICTRLCTYEHRLAVGLVTSPILADRLLRPVDRRIASMCQRANLTYSRFVDDLTISGKFDLTSSGIPCSISSILENHGFETNKDKFVHHRIDEECDVTGIRVRRGGIDITRRYAKDLQESLSDALAISRGQPPSGPFFTHNQLLGKVRFASWVNPGRKGRLHACLNRINWQDHERNACRLGLAKRKTTVIKRRRPRTCASV